MINVEKLAGRTIATLVVIEGVDKGAVFTRLVKSGEMSALEIDIYSP